MTRQDSLDTIIAAEGNLQVRLLHESTWQDCWLMEFVAQ